MKQILFLVFWCGASTILFLQTKSDTLQITEIVNLQLKLTGSQFERDFVLSKSSMPYDTTRSYYKPSEEFNTVLCGKYLDWSGFGLHSKFGSVATDSSDFEYSCFISTPVFNTGKTKCRLFVSTHYSEWGGNTRYYDYEKRGKRWKLAAVHTLSVS